MKAALLLTALALSLALASCMTTVPMEESSKTDFAEPTELQEPNEESGVIVENAENPEETPEVGMDASQTQESLEVQKEMETEPATEPGLKGPSGGTSFVCNGKSLEALVLDTYGKTYTEADTIAQGFAIITKTTAYSHWRLPTSQELICIYEQLYESGIMDIDETYYWANAPADRESATVVYFGTGFEGEFYKDMDFVGSIIVREL